MTSSGKRADARQPCEHDDLARFPLGDIAGLLQKGQLSSRQASQVFRRVNERYQDRDVLTDGELDALGEFRARLTDAINPYRVEDLDRRVKELDEKFPGWEHFYHRIGTTVTWYDRKRTESG